MKLLWIEKYDQWENGMDYFYTTTYLNWETREPLASYSHSTASYKKTSVTLYNLDKVAFTREIEGDQNEAQRICEAHLKLNLAYTGNAAPGKAIWKPHYTGD